jgi:hypothetical protein
VTTAPMVLALDVRRFDPEAKRIAQAAVRIAH